MVPSWKAQAAPHKILLKLYLTAFRSPEKRVHSCATYRHIATNNITFFQHLVFKKHVKPFDLDVLFYGHIWWHI